MKRTTRLMFAVLIAFTSLPALAADGSFSFWDELWSIMSGQASVSSQSVHDAAYCKAHPLECASGFQ